MGTKCGNKKGAKFPRPRYGFRVKGEMKRRVRGDKRRWRLVGLIIERVGGRGEACWSDRSAELKPSSGLLRCPADVKASAPRREKEDALRMLTAQGCLWNGPRITASSTSFPWVNIYDNHKGKSSVIPQFHLSMRRFKPAAFIVTILSITCVSTLKWPCCFCSYSKFQVSNSYLKSDIISGILFFFSCLLTDPHLWHHISSNPAALSNHVSWPTFMSDLLLSQFDPAEINSPLCVQDCRATHIRDSKLDKPAQKEHKLAH